MSTREQVETILRRWGNEASREDQLLGQALAGDKPSRARDRAVTVIVALVEGLAPREADKRAWWLDTNREDSERC